MGRLSLNWMIVGLAIAELTTVSVVVSMKSYSPNNYTADWIIWILTALALAYCIFLAAQQPNPILAVTICSVFSAMIVAAIMLMLHAGPIGIVVCGAVCLASVAVLAFKNRERAQ